MTLEECSEHNLIQICTCSAAWNLFPDFYGHKIPRLCCWSTLHAIFKRRFHLLRGGEEIMEYFTRRSTSRSLLNHYRYSLTRDPPQGKEECYSNGEMLSDIYMNKQRRTTQ